MAKYQLRALRSNLKTFYGLHLHLAERSCKNLLSVRGPARCKSGPAITCLVNVTYYCTIFQRWSRGHKARGQGHQKNPRPRPRTAFPRTDTLEAKDRNARGQGQGPRTQAQVLSNKKKKIFTKIFQAIFKKKKGLQKNFSGDLHKNTFSKKFFKRSTKFSHFKKLLLSSSRGQANFRGLEASRPRPRTSKFVLETKDVLENSTSAIFQQQFIKARVQSSIAIYQKLAKIILRLLQYSSTF